MAPPIEPVLRKNAAIMNRGLTIGQGLATAAGQQTIPSWNTPGRPEKAKTGTFGFNSQTKKLELWSGSKWLKLPMKKI